MWNYPFFNYYRIRVRDTFYNIYKLNNTNQRWTKWLNNYPFFQLLYIWVLGTFSNIY